MGTCTRRLVAVLLTVAAVLAGALTTPAEAHAYLVSSNPADGSRLDSAPARLELSFSEHVVAQATRISVVDTSGRAVRLTGLHLETEHAADTEEPATVVASFADRLPAAAYRVTWQTLSSDDLHRTSGMFVFGVERTVHATGVTEPRPAVEESGLRAGFLLGLALLLGGLLTERVMRRTSTVRAMPRRLATWGAVLALLMSVLLMVAQVVRAHIGLPSLLLSAYGVRWSLRSLGLVVLLVGVRRGRLWWRGWVYWLGLGLTCLGTAALGHAASGGFSPTRVLADAAHVAATLSWGGAVICLSLVLASGRTAGLGASMRAFAVPAAACLSVAVVTGLYLSSWVVGSVDAALLTFYGKTLGLKLVVVGAAAGLGLVNHLRLRHGSGVRLPRLTVPAEACAVVGAVLLTAILTSSQPATEPAYVRPSVTADTTPAVGQVADLEVSVGISPNRPGNAMAVIDVFDTRRPAPAPITTVSVSLAGQPWVEAQPLGDGHWSAPVAASRPGSTEIRVRTRRFGERDVSGTFSWTIGSGQVPRPALVSQTPLRGVLVAASAALGAVLVALWCLVALLRARRGLLRRRVDADPTSPGHVSHSREDDARKEQTLVSS